jgi:hypothetical protein
VPHRGNHVKRDRWDSANRSRKEEVVSMLSQPVKQYLSSHELSAALREHGISIGPRTPYE